VNGDMRLSVAIPLYNEEAGVDELLDRLRHVLDRIPGGPHEIVLVDDGSSDGTFGMLATAARADPRIVAISLSRNFGHQAALVAALDHVSGDLVVVMDGDLQDPPEVIPRLIEQHAQGFDVVYARRVARKEPWPLRVCYFLFYRLISRLSDVTLPVDAGDFALLSRRVVDLLRQLPEHHRYLRGLRAWAGFRQASMPIDRPERFAGHSKYNVVTLVGLAFDALFAFSMVPLRVAALVGLLTVGVSTLFAVYSLYVRLFVGPKPQGFTALIVAITFLSGVQLLFLGLIGEYVGRVYEETKGRPHYVVAEIVRRGREPT